jgi:hypothetical protein
MSEIKPKRAAREPAQSEAALAEVVAAATATAPLTERNIVPEPEAVSAIALVQAAPLGPACPVPAESESSPSDKTLEAVAESPWTAFAEAQSALARGFEKAAIEATGISRSGMAATADAAVALLGARTFAEAIEINAGLVRRGVDAVIEGSARLSEIGAQSITDASRPILSRFGRNWGALGGD